MKNLILLISLLFSTYIYAQEYHSMLTNGKEWHCIYEVKYSYNQDGEWPYVIKVCGDTTINNTTYKKMYMVYTDSVPNDCKKERIFVAYEKDKKVYRYNDGKSTLILDFNMHKGDIISSATDSYVEDEDYIEVSNVSYHRLKMSNGGIWVEGIGSNTAYSTYEMAIIDLPVAYYIDDYIIACYENGILLFTKDDFETISSDVKNLEWDDVNSDEEVYNTSGVKMSIRNINKGIYIQKSKKYIKKW